MIAIEADGKGFASNGDAASTRSGLSLAQALVVQSDAELVRDPTARGTRWRLLLNDPEARRASEAATS